MTNTAEDLTVLVQWLTSPRFADTTRLHTAGEILERRRNLCGSHAVARTAAELLHARLRELSSYGRALPARASAQLSSLEHQGSEALYIGNVERSVRGDAAGWHVSNELAAVVRAQLVVRSNQLHILGEPTTGCEDASEIQELVQRSVAAGVPGLCFDDRRPSAPYAADPSAVLAPANELVTQLSAARLHYDVLGVPGLIVQRTHAQTVRFLSGWDTYDQSSVLGATDLSVPSFDAASELVLQRLGRSHCDELSGYRSDDVFAEHATLQQWLRSSGVSALIDAALDAEPASSLSMAACQQVFDRFIDIWQREAGVKTFSDAVANLMNCVVIDPEAPMTPGLFRELSRSESLDELRTRAASLGIRPLWDCDHARSMTGAAQVRHGMDLAIARSLRAAPYADVLWLETDAPDMAMAQRFAAAIHREQPEKLLAYSWTRGELAPSDEETRWFNQELAALGYVLIS